MPQPHMTWRTDLQGLAAVQPGRLLQRGTPAAASSLRSSCHTRTSDPSVLAVSLLQEFKATCDPSSTLLSLMTGRLAMPPPCLVIRISVLPSCNLRAAISAAHERPHLPTLTVIETTFAFVRRAQSWAVCKLRVGTTHRRMMLTSIPNICHLVY